MIAAVVEILIVPRRSPPVPTTPRISCERVSASSGGWIDLPRSARGERGDFFNRLALFCECGQKIGFDVRRNGFVGEPFNCLADLFIRQLARGGELLCEMFEHAGSLSVGSRGSN